MKEWIIKYWLEIAFSFISGCCIAGYRHLKNKLECKFSEQEAIKLGIQALLRSEIIREYNKWIDLEYIPIYALDNIEILYKQYFNLEGEPPVTGLIEKLRELPTVKKDY